MANLQVENATRGQTLVTAGRVANNMWTRLRGLIGSKPLGPGQAMLISPCQSIHTHFMSFPIDVLYVDTDRRVVALDQAMPPWRFGRLYRTARWVLELPAGVIAQTGTQVGDQLKLDGFGS
jgi:uncharacterized membrane protein (UPF0127 family)